MIEITITANQERLSSTVGGEVFLFRGTMSGKIATGCDLEFLMNDVIVK